MHLGNARTALLAWLQVRAQRGTMVLRIEDLDRGRCRPIYVDAVQRDLEWLGLDWDEGPFFQSDRDELYQTAFDRLETYPCSCTRKELRSIASAPHGMEPVYPGLCRQGPLHPERPVAWRWRVPDMDVTSLDAWAPPQCQSLTRDVGDFVLRRNDGAWAYQLAVVVDDAAMGVTHVLRGEDLRSSTPRQIALQRSFGFTTPIYTHVPLLRSSAGVKLSKRDGVPDLEQLRLQGFSASELVARMAVSLGLVDASVHSVTATELVEGFSLERLDTGLGTLTC